MPYKKMNNMLKKPLLQYSEAAVILLMLSAKKNRAVPSGVTITNQVRHAF